MAMAQRYAAGSLRLLRSDRELPGHEALPPRGRGSMATGTCPSQPKGTDVWAEIPEAAASSSTTGTIHHQPVSSGPRTIASGYSWEEPSARKTHARICEGGVGQPAPLLDNRKSGSDEASL